ncbi:MAG TPA: hypothetical protein VJ723_08720 [Candidatus Angelobacter sp.]|nr:hypothetical protein [Candidatus Angelobacter sp.]
MRIVIVEDDHIVSNELRGLFRREFRLARVDTFRTEQEFQEAIPGFTQDVPTLVILDVMLPWSTPASPLPLPLGGDSHRGLLAGVRCASRLREANLPNQPWIILYTVWPPDQLPPEITSDLKPLIIVEKDKGPHHVVQVAHSILRAQLQDEPPFLSKPLPDRVFVIMPFSDGSVDTFKAVSRAIKSLKKGIRPHKIDSKPGSFALIEEIERAIDSCWLVVCDLSEERPNVYYELGYAVARGKRVVSIAKHGTHLHFNVAGRKTLFFENFTDLESRLRQEVSDLMTEESS